MPPLLALHDVSVSFGGETLFDGVSLFVSKGDTTCLVGRNGAGKSTLLKIAAALFDPDEGIRFLQPGIRVSYLQQEPDANTFDSVISYVASGLDSTRSNSTHTVEAILESVQLDPAKAPSTLSGGELRRAAIAQTLVGEPDIILLDEPTNHLDLPAIEWLEDRLRQFQGACVVISHDRRFLSALTTSCLWLEGKKIHSHTKGFEAFETWSESIVEQREEEQRRLHKKLQQEARWLHRGVTARRRRNQGRLRRLLELRQQKQELIVSGRPSKLSAESGSLSGRLVSEAKGISKRFTNQYGEKEIIAEFSTRIVRGDRVGIIGPNGIGKSTLLGLLTGTIDPDEGYVRLGANLEIAYLDQMRDLLNDSETLVGMLCPNGGDQVFIHGRPRHVLSYLKDFLFSEAQARQPVGSLSGGERNRLMLALSLSKPSNLLVLDEPTNDLDMETLDLLQEMLADYDGTILLVSHDRDFLDRSVTSTIVLEGGGVATEYAGGYSDYLDQRPAQPVPAQVTKSARRSPKKSPTKSKSKLSYLDQRTLKELSKSIPDLEQEITSLESSLADPDLYLRENEKFEKLTRRLEKARLELDELEKKWLELELRKEEFEKSSSNA